MHRYLVFEATEDADRIYCALIAALRFGRQLQNGAPGKDVLRKERDIMRALQKIGEPDPVKSEDLFCQSCKQLVMRRDPKSFRLRRANHQILNAGVRLKQSEIELLQERIDRGPWTGDAAVDMADALDFLGAAPEVKDEW